MMQMRVFLLAVIVFITVTIRPLSAQDIDSLKSRIINYFDRVSSIKVCYRVDYIDEKGNIFKDEETVTREGGSFRKDSKNWYIKPGNNLSEKPDYREVRVIKDGTITAHFVNANTGRISNAVSKNYILDFYGDCFTNVLSTLSIKDFLRTCQDLSVSRNKNIEITGSLPPDQEAGFIEMEFDPITYALVSSKYALSKALFAEGKVQRYVRALEFRDYGGISVPIKAIRKVGGITATYTVISIELNGDYAADFQIDFPDDTLIHNDVTGETYSGRRRKVQIDREVASLADTMRNEVPLEKGKSLVRQKPQLGNRDNLSRATETKFSSEPKAMPASPRLGGQHLAVAQSMGDRNVSLLIGLLAGTILALAALYLWRRIRAK